MNVRDFIPAYNFVVLPYHVAQSATASLINRRPAKNLVTIAVTGTNGKTTTCFMIWQMLKSAGLKAGLITTVAWGGVNSAPTSQIEHMTTPDAATLNRRIKHIRDAGATHLVLEVTSHALAQHRILGIPIDIAVMTNVTHEHLDYHKTFARYLSAKTRLFKLAKYGIINADDPSASTFAHAATCPYTFYGIKNPAKFHATSIKLLPSGVKYTCGDMNIQLNFPGSFNVYNSLATLAVGKKLGLSSAQIVTGLHALKSVEGRMNRLSVSPRQNFDVIVDFAHTPDAFQQVFESVSPSFQRSSGPRIISLFGGAGRRDESTRETRGQIAGRHSDLIILTEDDTRDENLSTIIKQFQNGAEQSGLKLGHLSASEKQTGHYSPHHHEILIEPNRRAAIELAFNLARPGDLVLLLGKGHEKTIIRGDGAHPFEDLKVAKQLLSKKFSPKKSEY